MLIVYGMTCSRTTTSSYAILFELIWEIIALLAGVVTQFKAVATPHAAEALAKAA